MKNITEELFSSILSPGRTANYSQENFPNIKRLANIADDILTYFQKGFYCDRLEWYYIKPHEVFIF